MARPQTAVRPAGEDEHILAANAAPHVPRARRPDRVGDLGPARAAIPTELDTVRRGDVHRVTARDDAVRRDVLPLVTQLVARPVGPRLPTIRRKPPAVPHGPVPDFTRRTERDGVDEVERDGAGGGVDRVEQMLPRARAGAQHKDALPVCAHPDGVVGRAGDCEHVDAETGRVGERRQKRLSDGRHGCPKDGHGCK